MKLQDLVTWLLPRDEKFFLLLEQHAEVLGDAAQFMASFVDNRANPHNSLDGLLQIEHRGDALVHAMTTALDETFVTPIDREDLHKLASCIDNVVDNLFRATDAFVMYEVDHFTPAMRELAQIASEASLVLKDAIFYIRKKQLEKLAPARLQIVAMEKRGDAVYQAEFAALFKNPAVDAKELLRQQAVLDALEAALDSCQDAADVLENVAIKHA